ncbi:GntR family transcriptional regulator [Marinilactibacillus sp. GCM10026970]|uniref:GntR family transcriptional regulator n=1 Tax=Marinilactibacillus sp. GCM10026970 TaxID=3252642 RepID=UPI003622FED4
MNKYQAVAQQINQFIQQNNLSQGDKLPTLNDLAEEYQVSKNTIIKAVEMLESHGIVYQVRGSGTYVRGRHRKGYVNLTDVHGFQGILKEFNLTSDVIELKEIEPDENIVEVLKLKENETVYYLKRIRQIESRPLCVEESYYNKSYVPYLNEDIVQNSVFSYLTNDLKIDINFSDFFMRIGKLNEEQAGYLDLKPQDPSIDIESIYYLNNGHPFDYSVIKYHYEEAQFYMQGNKL